MRFQSDTGAQCNVLPMHIYQAASEAQSLAKVIQGKSALVAYGGSRIPVVSEAVMRMWRSEKSYLLRYKLADDESICPILGHRACLGMSIIQYTDNVRINTPQSRGAAVFATEAKH